jgi:hypothetical protein
LTPWNLGNKVAPEATPLGQNGRPLNLDLREYVAEISHELTERLTHLQSVVDRVAAEHEVDGRPIEFCPLVDCRARQRYRAAVRDAVRVLAETRRSFKSRQLEDLRRTLEAVLTEDGSRGAEKI